MYNVSANCTSGLTCVWLLDNEVISNTPNTTVTLEFALRHIGNRTLSYVGYSANTPRILASLPLSILPSTSPGKVSSSVNFRISNEFLKYI
ncbi:unnamed protein product, partial [Rotaria sp. Silwood2]